MSSSLKDRYDSTPLFGGNAPFVEHCYEEYLRDPNSVSEAWRNYFNKLAGDSQTEVRRGPIEKRLATQAAERRPGQGLVSAADAKQAAVARLIQVYRQRGQRKRGWRCEA